MWELEREQMYERSMFAKVGPKGFFSLYCPIRKQLKLTQSLQMPRE